MSLRRRNSSSKGSHSLLGTEPLSVKLIWQTVESYVTLSVMVHFHTLSSDDSLKEFFELLALFEYKYTLYNNV